MPKKLSQQKVLEIREREVQGFLDRGAVPPPRKPGIRLGVGSGDFDEVPMTAEQRTKFERELAEVRSQLETIRSAGPQE